ncbi:diguanylate cyclase [Dokdonella soli]|uniref:VOC family protein n=1 Tax=Dokdonella soli TaxID=529810 RepID=A0ABP3TPV9_9GAMM
MTKAIGGLNHINFRAPEDMIERLRAFYCEVIGLCEGPRPPFRSRGYWLYAGDRDLLHLTIIPADADVATNTATPAARTGWLDHVAFTGVDRAESIRRLEAAGIAYEIDEVPMIGQVQVFLTDPAGMGVELNFAR